MAIGAGRAAGWLGRSAVQPLAVAAIGGGALYGMSSAILDRNGPYAPLQEFVSGDPEMIRSSLKAGLHHAVTPDNDVLGRGDYYYGQQVSPRARSTEPVSGNVVLGAYNLRRG